MREYTFGYQGQILTVDLDTSDHDVISLGEDLLRKLIGGSGTGIHFLLKTGRVDLDPMDPNSPLIFMTGPCTNTVVPMSGRHQVMGRSPLTGILGESDAGGSWGEMLKRAGFDGIIITGKSEGPVYIYIEDGKVHIRKADDFWGMDTYEVSHNIQKETHPNAVVACIGQAGEKQVPLAGIMHNGPDARPAARCGLGALMGSKRLKAIAVYGHAKTRVADENRLLRIARKVSQKVAERGIGFRNFGTAAGMTTTESLGDLPIKNWRDGSWVEGAKRISGQALAESMLTGRFACGRCPVGCGRRVSIEDQRFGAVHGQGPEYESLASLGSLCLVDNLVAIAKGNELCNRYGIDTISTGSVIAFAMECYEKGIISRKDAGIALKWGDPEALLKMIEYIGEKKDFGKVLGLGVRRAADVIGGGSHAFANHVKGLELPAHDPRCFNGLAVGYATSNRGACHLQGFSYPFERSLSLPELGYTEVHPRFGVEGKGEFVAKLQDLMSVLDSAKVCKFAVVLGMGISDLVEMLNAVTGFDYTIDEVLKAGARIFNMKRLYNNHLGVRRKDDTLPVRITSEVRGSGGSATNLPPLDKMLQEYYTYRDWNEDGTVSARLLEYLGIGEYAHLSEAGC